MPVVTHTTLCISRQSRIAALQGSGTQNRRGVTGNVSLQSCYLIQDSTSLMRPTKNLLCSVITESESTIDSLSVGFPLLMQRQFINFCLSCSTCFFATNSSQFFKFLAISCMIFLEEPISQFQFSIQADFVSLSLTCPSLA